MDEIQIQCIARIYTDFSEKFGIPRQSGLVKDVIGKIVFEKEFRDPDMLRGITDFSHLWLIWGFSENRDKRYTSTVRPPRLGGNQRLGVFATRSPFRPNGLGLSCVKLEKIEKTEGKGNMIYVSGVDMLNGTPIYDIKPYVPYADSYPEAAGSFTEQGRKHRLKVLYMEELLEKIPLEKRNILTELLEQDPRPSYQSDDKRVYGMSFAEREIKFTVAGDVLTVCDII